MYSDLLPTVTIFLNLNNVPRDIFEFALFELLFKMEEQKSWKMFEKNCGDSLTLVSTGKQVVSEAFCLS